MLLAVDIGNTNIVFGLFDKSGKLTNNLRLETKRDALSSYYISFFTKNKISRIKIDSVIISSVVPQAKKEFLKFCTDYLKIKPFDVSDNIKKLGIKIKIDRPEEVGADRIVNSIAFYSRYKKSGIVVDFGTATTFDVIDSNGDYLGGMISPGINLAISALVQAAAKLPEINIVKPHHAIGKTTKEAMQSGIYYGYLGLIERSIKEITSELKKNGLNTDPVIVATGGLAGFFESSESIDFIEENLTLEGLLIINKRMKGKI